MKVIVTNHAYDRFFERMDFTEEQAEAFSEEAIMYGTDERVLDEKTKARYQKKMKESNFLKIYKNHIYIFEERDNFTYVLITVYPLQEKFRRRKRK